MKQCKAGFLPENIREESRMKEHYRITLEKLSDCSELIQEVAGILLSFNRDNYREPFATFSIDEGITVLHKADTFVNEQIVTFAKEYTKAVHNLERMNRANNHR